MLVGVWPTDMLRPVRPVNAAMARPSGGKEDGAGFPLASAVGEPVPGRRHYPGKMRPGGTLLLMGGTGSRRIGHGLGIASAATAVLPPFTAALALELAPVRVNLIAAGFVDTPLSASLLGDQLEERRNELRATLPIGRVVGPADVAALAVHIMTNTALTGATYDIDGGQQFVS